jgi:hypothetical protein
MLNRIDNICKWLLLCPIYLIKSWKEQKLYLQTLMPVIGLWEAFRCYKLKRIFLPLGILFFLGMVQALILEDKGVFIRCLQGFFLVYFGQFLTKYLINDTIYAKLCRNIAIISAFYFLLELITTKDYLGKEMMPGFVLYRFFGVIGESNFSGLLFAAILFICLYQKWYKLMAFFALMILTTMSRSYMALSLITVIGYYLVLKNKKIAKISSLLIVFSVALAPILLMLFEWFAPESLKLIAAEKTNGRYAIWITYISIFKSHLWGVGYFKGPDFFQSFAHQGSSIVTNNQFMLLDFPLHQHSMPIQTISEFGIWGFALLCWFIFEVTRFVYQNTHALFLWAMFLLGTCSLNVFHEFSFYLMIAFVNFKATELKKVS